MKKYVWFGLIVLFLAACTGSGTSNKGVTSVPKEDFDFKVEQIFDKAIVEKAASQSSDAELVASQTDLAEAKQLANNESLDKSKQKLTEAILKYPTPEAYFELGKVNIKQGNYEKAVEALTLATDLGYKNLGDINFQKAIALGNQNVQEAVNVLKDAVDAGFSDYGKLIEGEELSAIRGTDAFMAWFDSSGIEKNNNVLFQIYLNSFPKGKLPYAVGANELNDKSFVYKYIAYEFESFVPELAEALYADEPTDDLLYKAHLGLHNGYHVVVYAGKPMEVDDPPLFYFVAAYNENGELSDKLLLASKEDLNQVFFGEVAADYTITVSENEITLGENAGDNDIITSKMINEKVYILNKQGKFIDKEEE